MNTSYNREKNLEILIAMLKRYGIRKVIASPGMTNSNFVASLQSDPFFVIYSSVDERSAAYMACGMAEELQEPVAISCTGATAAREWAPGLTEAYYRHLPVLAITSSQPNSRIGHLIPQVTDRSRPMPDMVKMSVDMPLISSGWEDERSLVVIANEALLELKHHGGGPVHINLITNYDLDFSVKELPDVSVINRICYKDTFPELPKTKIFIVFKNDTFFDKKTITSINAFCMQFDAHIVSDEPEKLNGFNVEYIISAKTLKDGAVDKSYLLMQIGQDISEISTLMPTEVWRISQDGEIIDLYGKLTYVFEMREEYFFNRYNSRFQKLDYEKLEESNFGDDMAGTVWTNKSVSTGTNDLEHAKKVSEKSNKSFLQKIFKK